MFVTTATDDTEGKPNLVISSRDRALFTPLKMYLRRKLIPSAEHILICQNTTSTEEIESLIFRCMHGCKRSIITTCIQAMKLIWANHL